MTTPPQPLAAVPDFEEYVRTRHDALLRSARRLVRDPLDAQDLLQTALLRTYTRWDRITDKRLADAYLRRVMINTRAEWWWRAQRLQELPSAYLPETSVEDSAERHADRTLLTDLVKSLAPQQRAVVVLRHWEQMSTQETAAALGLSPGTVKSTLHRALGRLREELLLRTGDSATVQRAEHLPPARPRRSRPRPGPRRRPASTAAADNAVAPSATMTHPPTGRRSLPGPREE
ncbi:SigE family RNA polymerase sigma factor [Streptomyces cyanogenus]|uniref:RNA polymerase sigma factor n=1 Tax=Streptomyces cyanogenus TaxID=80860 RepID=A0ABX7TIK0_STRCY|nr:SigE family RNA polymerase sigma factor [Streptomyces cyanogenus]QTD96081.1 RNA polymerase sigma-E factor [Streptomyces cyanogenus]